MNQVEQQEAERILARKVASELTVEEIQVISGGLMAGTSYDTCSGGQGDACDID